MKRTIIHLSATLICVAMAGIFGSCSKFYGEPTTQNYTINGSYTKLDISHAFDVTVSDEVTQAVVTVPEELHSKLKLEVRNGTLYIGFTRNLIVSGSQCTAILPLNPQLKDLELSGASSFVGDLQGVTSDVEVSGASDYKGSINATKVEFDISGASSAKCTVFCDQAEADVSGSSDLNLTGACTGIMDIDVSGSSRLNAIPFNTDAITGELSGSSDADVTVCNRIAVSVSGASDLTYGTSSPDCRPEYRCTTSGSSSVTPR